MISLSVESLACVRGGRAVFGGLGFEAAGGDAIELRGPNGAGKSSLLRLLAGLAPPAAGAVVWTGGAETSRPPLTYCGHRDPVKAWLTVREQLAWWRDLGGNGDIEAAAGAMGIAPLLEVAGGLLSAGQRRRLALTRLALAETPEFNGRVIHALLEDPMRSKKSGQTLITAELALEYGIQDEGGRQPPSYRDALGEPRIPHPARVT